MVNDNGSIHILVARVWPNSVIYDQFKFVSSKFKSKNIRIETLPFRSGEYYMYMIFLVVEPKLFATMSIFGLSEFSIIEIISHHHNINASTSIQYSHRLCPPGIMRDADAVLMDAVCHKIEELING